MESWRERIIEDWAEDASADQEREKAMKSVNPNFVPRGWLLDEVIERVEKRGDREIMAGIMKMALKPFEDNWNWKDDDEKRFVGDVPKFRRAIQCSCSS